MKRIPILLLIAFLLVSAFSPAFIITASAEAAELPDYGYMTDFVTQYPERDAGTDGEAAAAGYLADFFETLGLTGYNDGNFLQPFQFENPYNSRTYDSNNVVAVLPGDGSTGKQIIIGAHYDSFSNPEGITGTYGDGAYDNGSGVAAMMKIAYDLTVTGSSLSFNVVFAAFGAEELGLFGSEYMAKNMTAEEKAATALMINFDSIGCGDYLYLYTDEVDNLQNTFMLDKASEMGIELKGMPKDRKTYPVYEGYAGLPYNYDLLMSDHASFMNEGIDVAFFVGYNIEGFLEIPGESVEKPEIMHTGKDTLTGVAELYGDLPAERIADTAALVEAYLNDSELLTVLESSRAAKYNYRLWINSTLINALEYGMKIILAIAVIIMIALVNRGAGKDIGALPTEEVKEEPDYIYKDLGI